MREGEFKEWMQLRRLKDTTISTQMSKARKLDRYFGDLDKHISDGTIDTIAAKLADPASLPSDLGNPGERNHLAQSLSYYCKFANSSASGVTSESDADRIRHHALENYIEPARAAGQRQIDILVSDVNRALGLRDAWPNICQALAGKKFQELARVPSPTQIGADMSSATIFRFDVSTAALSNDNILARFEENSPFKAVRQGWNAAQTEAFCDVARTVHDLGLDWWHVNVSPWQLRFGRKSTGRSRAEAVLGILLGSPPRIDFRGGRIGLGQNNIFALTAPDAQRFIAILRARAADINAWQLSTSPHPGRWPDEHETELVQPTNITVEESEVVTASKPINLILYGPPGTGKTFSTAEEAVRLCDGSLPDGDTSQTRRRYEELVNARQIQFVTFHQSYAYEDFVEGLRPITGDGEEEGSTSITGGFRLKPIAGVFREIATLAEQARKAAFTGEDRRDFDFADRKYWKMGLGAIGSEDHVYDAAIAGNYVALGWGANVDWSDPRFESLTAMQKEWAERYPDDKTPSQTAQPWTLRNRVKIGDLIIVPYGNSAFRAIAEVLGKYYFKLSEDGTYNQRRDVRWLLTLDEPLPLDTIIDGNFTQRTLYEIPDHRLRKEALIRLISGSPRASGPGRPDQFVLIIDEINRANISKVFGELITLIEPDKRIGGAFELKATLPYSKISFGVPDNLHIIGTMNTADRSIALLDTALRRRFEFRELMPQSQLLGVIDGIDLSQLLTMVNERIEYLFDRDHQIGHSFFMRCESRADIDDVMRFKVIPLLSEYFYDDWSKVAAALGDDDVKEGDHEGGFFDCRPLKAPAGLSSEEDSTPRYRWQLRETFSYQKLQ